MSRGYRFSDAGGVTPSVPDGKTVTPINDIPTWLSCAGLNNTGYTTLSEVLNDTGVLSTLMSTNNAVDYMVRSKQFGIKPIPPMTNATTPSGIVSAYSVNSTNLAYYVFNGNYNDGLFWQSNPQSTSMAHLVWIQYEFPTAVCAKSIFWKAYKDNNTESPLQYRLAASNDGTNFVDLVSGSKIVGTDGEEFLIQFSNNTSYKFYRWYSSGGYYQNQFYANTRKLQLYYQDANIVDNERAMYFIGQNNYASDTLLADPDWREAICNSTYFENVLNYKVPTMSSDTTPEGQCFGSERYPGYGISYYGAFDNDNSSYVMVYRAVGSYVGYKFADSCKINKVSMSSSSFSNGETFKLQGSNDGLNYYDITTFAQESDTHSFVCSAPYLYYRVYMTNTGSMVTTGFQYFTLQFYGHSST